MPDDEIRDSISGKTRQELYREAGLSGGVDKDAPFPLDWNEWRKQWNEWKRSETRLLKSNYKFPGKNFIADEVLGVYGISFSDGSGRVVELSETTFMGTRGVGITYASGDQRFVPSEIGGNNVVYTFGELERELFGE